MKTMLLALAGASACLLSAQPASAAYPCEPVSIDETQYKVGVVNTNCATAHHVVERFLERWTTGEAAPVLRVDGFRCSGASAASTISCRSRGDRWVLASSQPGVDPAAWSPPKPVLGRQRAQQLMRRALDGHPRLYFDLGNDRRVKCNRRLSPTRRLCKMSWFAGDLVHTGQGKIWISSRRGDPAWSYSYRLTRIDEYCLFVTKGPKCVRMVRGHS